jgi:hypothetical protein
VSPSDIFSLGCVLAYAVTGKPPFTGDSAPSILFRIVSTEPDLSTIPPGFRQVIQACLKKNPAERPTPGQLLAMINELGPATPMSLGSFWPSAVARVIAAEQAAQTPDGLTPPAPFAPTSTSGAGMMSSGMTEVSGPAGLVSPGPAAASLERTPTALATPSSGPVAGGSGHARMISDGYLDAAAQQPSAQTPIPSGPSIPPMPAPPQSYSRQPPYVAQQPGGQVPSGPRAPYSGQAPPYGGQAPSYPGQQPGAYPGQQPGGLNPMSQYAPGRRKPMTAEVPPLVHNAIRLMYAGFVVTVVDIVLSLVVFGQYSHDEDLDKKLGDTSAASSANSMGGAIAIGFIADILGLACWAWLAIATRRGNGWTRIAGTVLLGIYSVITLVVVFGTKADPGAEFTTIVVWALGVASVIPLWSQQAREFFFTWRKR